MMRSAITWRVSLIGFAIASALLLGVGWITIRRMADLRDASGWVQHTWRVRSEAEGVLSLLKDAETGQRGFVITGAPAYLGPYETGLAALPVRLEQLRQLTTDNAVQQTNVARLTAIVQQKTNELRQVVAIRQRDGFEAAAREVETGAGKRTMDEARGLIAAIDGEENRLLAEREAREAQEARYAVLTILGGLASAIALLGGATLLMSRASAERERERGGRVTAEAVAEAVRQSEERLRVTIASIGDGVIATDELGRVTRFNAVAEALTGWTEADALNRPLDDVFVIVNESSRQPVENPVRKVINTGRMADLANHTVLIAKDGRNIHIDDSAAPITTADGQMVGVVLVFRDISARRKAEREREHIHAQLAERMRERQQSEEAARQARREAEHANRLKDEFLAMVSHELRTPLNAVMGWADMLRTGLVPEDRRDRALTAIFTNAKRQERLIGELLDVSRIMSGKFPLERTAVDLQEVVRAAVEVVQTSADAKDIELTADIEPGLPPIDADPTRLQQILWNLLSNAIKFTPGAGAILVQMRRAGADVEIVVADTGQGITADFLPAIFEPFQQADMSTTRRHGGLGLGLSIVRYLAEAHGGTVSAASAGEGRGSTFIVRLPIAADDADRRENAAARQTGSTVPDSRPGPASLHGLSVLVVDDDDDSRELLAATLQSHGALVLSAASAAEGLRTLSGHRVHVLLSDVAMPGEDGYTFIRKVRARETPGSQPLPAVALTSFAREEDRQAALRAGFQMHLAKPMDSRSLVEAITSLVNGKEEP